MMRTANRWIRKGTIAVMLTGGAFLFASPVRGQAKKEAPTVAAETIALKFADASRVKEMLDSIRGDVKGEANFIEADASKNSILIHGDARLIREVKSLIQALDLQ